MTYSLINKCAKNYYNRTFIVQVIAKNVVTCFFLRHSVGRHHADLDANIYATFFTSTSNAFDVTDNTPYYLSAYLLTYLHTYLITYLLLTIFSIILSLRAPGQLPIPVLILATGYG